MVACKPCRQQIMFYLPLILPMPAKIFGKLESRFWNIDAIQIHTLVIDQFFMRQYWYKLDMSTARRHLKSLQSLSGTSAHPTMVTLVNIMVMNGWLTSFSSMSIGRPIPEIRLFQTLTLKLTPVYYEFASFSFHISQTNQQFMRYSYFKIWPGNNKVQGHEWGQRSRSHIIPSIYMWSKHFLFVSHQSDQPFLRYGQNSV